MSEHLVITTMPRFKTAVIVGDESAPEQVSLALVNPFLFFIRDNATGSILFVGRIADPSAS